MDTGADCVFLELGARGCEIELMVDQISSVKAKLPGSIGSLSTTGNGKRLRSWGL